MRRVRSGILSLCLLASSLSPGAALAVDWSYLYILMAEVEQGLEPSAIEPVAEDLVPERSMTGPETSPGAEEDEGFLPWSEIKARFDRICGKLQVAPDLPVEEVEGLIEECKLLRRALEQSDEPQAKVLLKRLKMCQDFFEYSLEVR